MKKTVGLWIDHKKAVIVFVAGKDTEIKLISSSFHGGDYGAKEKQRA